MYYGQNMEDKFIFEFFNGFIGNCLSIGENNGKSFSNVLKLIENGWAALLVEPSLKVFPSLVELHKDNENVYLANVAIGNDNHTATFYDSGNFLLKGTSSLLSTLIPHEKKRWGELVEWEESKVPVITFKKLIEDSPIKKFEFISIDAEGLDLDILLQMDLLELGCKAICVEHNSKSNIKKDIFEYCQKFGLIRTICENAENIILVNE